MNKIINNLSIVLITYNRANLAKKTLDNFVESPFNGCEFTILDNSSTDNTVSLIKDSADKLNAHIISNCMNLGGNANILRALEYAHKKYIWIIADDDEYDFSYTDDLGEELEKDYGIIHLGGFRPSNNQIEHRGYRVKIKEAISQGYPYFANSAFLPSNIYNLQKFKDNVIEAYRNIINLTPHLPYAINEYLNNNYIYITKTRIVTPVMGAQTYSFAYVLTRRLTQAKEYLKSKKEKSIFLYDQGYGKDPKSLFYTIIKYLLSGRFSLYDTLKYYHYLKNKDKLMVLIKIPVHITKKILSKIGIKN